MGKTRTNSNAANLIKLFLITTLTAAAAAIILLLISAVLLEKLGLKEAQMQYIVYAVYLITALLAGMVAGKCQKEKKFMWGALAGTVWFAILLAASVFLNDSGIDTRELFPAVVCMVGGGMLGGMLA